MMKIIKDPTSTAPCVLVLGMFDGVHRGHQALLMRGAALAEELGVALNVCTFEPHPFTVLRPDKAPARLTTQAERAQLMAGFGVDSLCVMSFTRAMADQAPEDFMAAMTAVFSPRAVVCGFNFTFGRRGQGTGESLMAYGAAHGFDTVIVPEVVLEGATVSSTRIRGLLAAGSIPEAARLLGHAVTFTARAEGSGKPGCAHLTLPRAKALPAGGVYACYVTLDGQNYPAMVQIQAGEGAPCVTVEVLDSCLRLQGRRVRVTLMTRLRAMDAVGDAAWARRAEDAEMARQYFFTVH